ncbi:hypothetical protein L1987_70677 [Smallanthus sonchifolius]|uniref:Uncharacterized protein n=1 Tax=Smallanthus sonchifolius TaxID=185202 RepID=A0ACB9ARX3_9ASTR|nr:hypothetical protein L1987_70677 [Smallanthus sonchifolius]
MWATASPMDDISFVDGTRIGFLRFYVPKNQADPPPADGITVQKWGLTYVAVRQFGGFVTDSMVGVEAAALSASFSGTIWADAVKNSHAGEITTSYTVAQYNSPFEFDNRVNEIWFKFNIMEENQDVSATNFKENNDIEVHGKGDGRTLHRRRSNGRGQYGEQERPIGSPLESSRPKKRPRAGSEEWFDLNNCLGSGLFGENTVIGDLEEGEVKDSDMGNQSFDHPSALDLNYAAASGESGSPNSSFF